MEAKCSTRAHPLSLIARRIEFSAKNHHQKLYSRSDSRVRTPKRKAGKLEAKCSGATRSLSPIASGIVLSAKKVSIRSGIGAPIRDFELQNEKAGNLEAKCTMMAIIIKTAVHSPRRAHPINKRLSGSQFGYPQRFQIHATRAPQAVARAVAHSCVGCIVVAAHKLWPALLSLLILRMFQRLEFLGSDFGNPHRFQTPATRMPQAVARAVAHSCVDVSPLLLKLRRPLLLFVILRLFQKLSFSGSNARNPQRFQISVTRMPQAVARAVAHSCVDVSWLLPRSRHKVISLVILQMSQKLIFSGSSFGRQNMFPFLVPN